MKIEDYSFGRITIDGKSYTKDVILLPPKVLSPWWRQEGHRLAMVDLVQVVVYKPEVLIVGTGANGLMKVPDEVEKQLSASNIAVEVMVTERACFRFAEIAKRFFIAGAARL